MDGVIRPGATAPREQVTRAYGWLTVEVGAYAALMGVGLLLRLLRLGAWPLSADELGPALSAWRAVQGDGWRAPFYSPLLFDVNLLLFALTRAGDATVRILPMVAGTVLVGAPYLFRHSLGRTGALATAVLVALSPIGVYLSRAGDGAILALLCTVLALAALEHDRPRWLVIAAALGVLTAPLLYTLPIGVAIVVLVGVILRKPVRALDRPRALVARISRRDLALGGVILILGATGLTANLAGVGATAEVAWRWFVDLASPSDAGAWWWLAASLGHYEPLTVALALVGCACAVRRKDAAPWELGFMLWLAWALLVGTVGGHRGALWIGQAWLPAVILAGRGADRLLAAWGGDERDARDWAGVAVALVAIGFAWLQLVAYQQTGQRIRLSLMIWGLGAGLVLMWGLGLWCGARRALCVAACALGLTGGGLYLAQASALATRTARDPRELLHGWVVSEEVCELEALVERAATKGGHDRNTLRVAYDRALDDRLGWVLRGYPLARASDDPLGEGADVWITRALPEHAWPARAAGRSVALRETLAWRDLTAMERLRWVVTRLPVGTPVRETVQVWLPLDLADGMP